MADDISVTIAEETIAVTMNGGAYVNPGVDVIDFAIPLALDGTVHKDWKCSNVSGDTTVNLTNISDGEAGMIELINAASGVVTLGTMFTKNAGGGTYDSASGIDNIIAWTKSGLDIIYSISQVE